MTKRYYTFALLSAIPLTALIVNSRFNIFVSSLIGLGAEFGILCAGICLGIRLVRGEK